MNWTSLFLQPRILHQGLYQSRLFCENHKDRAHLVSQCGHSKENTIISRKCGMLMSSMVVVPCAQKNDMRALGDRHCGGPSASNRRGKPHVLEAIHAHALHDGGLALPAVRRAVRRAGRVVGGQPVGAAVLHAPTGGPGRRRHPARAEPLRPSSQSAAARPGRRSVPYAGSAANLRRPRWRARHTGHQPGDPVRGIGGGIGGGVAGGGESPDSCRRRGPTPAPGC